MAVSDYQSPIEGDVMSLENDTAGEVAFKQVYSRGPRGSDRAYAMWCGLQNDRSGVYREKLTRAMAANPDAFSVQEKRVVLKFIDDNDLVHYES